MRRLAFVVLLAGAVLAGLACHENQHVYACYGTSDRLVHSPLCPRIRPILHGNGDGCLWFGMNYLVGFDSYREAAKADYIAGCPDCMQLRGWNN